MASSGLIGGQLLGETIQVGQIEIGELRFFDVSLQKRPPLFGDVRRREQSQHAEQSADLAQTAVDGKVGLPDAHARCPGSPNVGPGGDQGIAETATTVPDRGRRSIRP